MLSSSEEIASRGSIFLYVADLAAERRRLDEAGIALGSDIAGDYSTLAQVRDPDGNLITLATPPSGPRPRKTAAWEPPKIHIQPAMRGACPWFYRSTIF